MAPSEFDAALRLAAIVESSDDAIVGKDLNGIITSWNAAAERIFGYTAAEAIGRSIRFIIPPDRQAEEDEVLARIRSGNKIEHFETIRQRKDGSHIAISLSVSPIRDVNGVVIGASKIAHDITEQRLKAAALEDARAAQADLQQRLRALVDASAHVLASPRVSDVLDAVLGVAGRILKADGFAIWGLLPGSAWQVRACAGVSEGFAAGTVAAVRTAAGEPLAFSEPMLIEDVRTAPTVADRLPVYESEGIRAFAAIPLLMSGETTGSLNLYYRRPHRFSTVEVETARALGNMTAAALTTAELYEQQRHMRDRAAFLAQASRALARSLDMQETLKTVVELAVPVFADSCAIHLVGDAGAVTLAASMHADPSKNAAMLKLASRPNAQASRGWRKAVRDGTVELLEEVDAALVRDLLGGEPELMAAYDEVRIVSQLTVPMRAHGRLLGAITFALGPGTRRYGTDDVELAEDLGGRCATAIVNAQLFVDAQRREAEAAWAHSRAAFLADAGAALAGSLEYHETLRTVASLAVPRLADWCAVDILEESGETRRVARASASPEPAQPAPAAAADVPHGAAVVIQTGAPLMVPDVGRDTDVVSIGAPGADLERVDALRSLGFASYLCVPLVAQGRAIGALTLATTQASPAERHFNEADLRFAQDIGLRMALAIENSRAYAEARRANHLKDEFLATLSHELRTPLNAILGYAQMLRDGTVSPDRQQRAFTILERNASALAQMVSDILDVSRIIAGKVRLDARPAELGVLVTDAISTIMPAADARGVAVRTHLDATVGPIVADSDRLQQVIWNLISNAVKFTPQGGTVDVSVEREDEAAVIVVRDTGAGIAPEFLPHVFERFRQGDGRFTREHGGLGLGLAIARHLVEMHGGTIRAESEGLGRGATFRVLLPAAARPAAIAAEA